MKLVLFGDSLLAHVSKHRIQIFESRLKDLDIYNCAVGGWDTSDCVSKGPYIASLKPDVVFISLGTNDAAPWKQIPIEDYKLNITKIISCFYNSKIIWLLPPPIHEAKSSRPEKDRTNETLRQYHDVARGV